MNDRIPGVGESWREACTIYKVSLSLQNNARIASIIPMTDILQSIHFSPLPGTNIPREWTNCTVLEECSKFLINAFTDTHLSIISHTILNSECFVLTEIYIHSTHSKVPSGHSPAVNKCNQSLVTSDIYLLDLTMSKYFTRDIDKEAQLIGCRGHFLYSRPSVSRFAVTGTRLILKSSAGQISWVVVRRSLARFGNGRSLVCQRQLGEQRCSFTLYPRLRGL